MSLTTIQQAFGYARKNHWLKFDPYHSTFNELAE